MNDSSWMQLALDEARLAAGLTSPNPSVGAVVVKDGRLIGRGHHRRAGLPHAEPEALAACSEDPRGATLYVTLEPCCTRGRTPPCTQAVIKAGIARVVYGIADPNPAHAGAGLEVLRQAGVEVAGPVLPEECWALNHAFFKWISKARPWVHLKLATTLDGRIAIATGESRWITGPAARARVQEFRRLADAIIVGGDTCRLDDPSLRIEDPEWPKQPKRLVWTRRPESLSPDLKVFRSDDGAAARCLQADSAAEWDGVLAALAAQGVTRLLCEGGGSLAASLLAAGCVDQVSWFIAPKILGGAGSRPAVAGADPSSLDAAWQVQGRRHEVIGDDFLIEGFLGQSWQRTEASEAKI